MDDKEKDTLMAALAGNATAKQLFRSRPPRRLCREVQLGSMDGILIVLKEWRPLSPRKLLVAPGYAVVEVSINGEAVGFEEDFERCRTREYLDEDDPRWRLTENGDLDEAAEQPEPAVVEGSYDIDLALPILRAEDKIEMRAEWRGAGEAKPLFVALLGSVWEEESDVQAYELMFDSGRAIEVGESVEIRADVDKVARIDHLYVAGGSRAARNFQIEQICIGTHRQLVGDGVLAEFMLGMNLRQAMETLRPKLVAMIKVRVVGEMPRWFRGKLIGVAHEEPKS